MVAIKASTTCISYINLEKTEISQSIQPRQQSSPEINHLSANIHPVRSLLEPIVCTSAICIKPVEVARTQSIFHFCFSLNTFRVLPYFFINYLLFIRLIQSLVVCASESDHSRLEHQSNSVILAQRTNMIVRPTSSASNGNRQTTTSFAYCWRTNCCY